MWSWFGPGRYCGRLLLLRARRWIEAAANFGVSSALRASRAF